MTYRDQDEFPFEEATLRRAAVSRVPYVQRVETPRLVRPDLPPAISEQSIPRAPWHERLVERFFAAPPPVDPLRKNGRLYSALALFLIAFLLVGAKLFKLQVIDHAAFSAEAAEQYKMEVPIDAKRGLIYDRNGIILADNSFVVKFALDPRAIVPKHKAELAALLSETFDKPASYYENLFRDTSRQYIVIERAVPLEVASQLDSVKDPGLIREMDSRRNYAFGDRAAHVLGFASNDGRGLAGIELFANHDLAGHEGFQVMQRDGRGVLRPDVDYTQVPAANGENLTLTIDQSIQEIAESALKSGVAKADAEAGIAIVMQPSTGQILALANVPDFDPNSFSDANFNMLRDRAITDAYEPGSTIKVLDACTAIEEGAWKPTDKIYAEHGTWHPAPGVTIRDDHDYDTLTFRQALEVSSNISFAKISDKIDKRRYYEYLRDFGLGNYTGIDLPGEVKGMLHTPALWNANSKRYMAFGYELTVTPIQMATAYATVANMGIMMKPYIIMKRERSGGTIVTQPQEIRRVVSAQTCRTVINLMESVVDSGTGTLARIKGINIAGKTGTAQQLFDGHWSKEHYTASFTGFFPAEHPQYLISVILRSPHNGYFGGSVSAPIFREIAMNILEMNHELPPEARTQPEPQAPMVTEGVVDIDGVPVESQDEPSRQLWEVRGLTAEQGRSLMASQGFVVAGPKDERSSESIIDDVIKCGGDTVRFVLASANSVKSSVGEQNPTTAARDEQSSAPDFVGMPMARAIKLASADGFRVKMSGSGTVAQQFPEAGARVSNEAAGSPTLTLFGEEQ
ncbi:MAG: penicillin-binding transpeptidase domain-containing protein [Candidatus Kapaibacterium sp.]